MVAQVFKFRVGEKGAGPPLSLPSNDCSCESGSVSRTKLLGMNHRQFTQQDGIEHAEDRRVRSNAERQGENSNRGESGLF